MGDALGVGFGHFGYCVAKNAMGYRQDLTAQFHTSVLLSTACVFSGGAWQPIVNFVHDSAHCGFNAVAFSAFAGCSFMFFAGLRFGRLVWSPMLIGVAPNNYLNLKADALLGLAVGGATGAFVGTDVSFMGADGVEQNWLRPTVGIEEGMSDLEVCLPLYFLTFLINGLYLSIFDDLILSSSHSLLQSQ
jgi:hypothetical protein